MKTGTIILLVILAVLVGILVALYFFGRRMQEKQEQQNAQLQASGRFVGLPDGQMSTRSALNSRSPGFPTR